MYFEILKSTLEPFVKEICINNLMRTVNFVKVLFDSVNKKKQISRWFSVICAHFGDV